MDISKLPLNKKVTVIAEKFIIAIAKRTSSNEAIISYVNLKNHKEVLRILEKIDNGAQTLLHVDPEYWDIYADGDFISNFDVSLFKDLDVKVKATTMDKSLEIASFHKSSKSIPPFPKKSKRNIIGKIRQ